MRTKVRRSDKPIKALLSACFPDWKGRKVSVRTASTYQMSDYWSEGSRNYVRAYSLADGSTADVVGAAQTPMNAAAHARVEIPSGIAMVEHSIFCGKDSGITIYVRESDLCHLVTPALDASRPALALDAPTSYVFVPSVGRTVSTDHCPRDVWRIDEIDEASDSALCVSSYGHCYWLVASTLAEVAGPFHERNPSGGQ